LLWALPVLLLIGLIGCLAIIGNGGIRMVDWNPQVAQEASGDGPASQVPAGSHIVRSDRAVPATSDRMGAVLLTIAQASVPVGSHELVVHLHPEWNLAGDVGIETSLHIVARESYGGGKRMPKPGAWSSRTKNLVRPGDEPVLVWTLPDELPLRAMEDAAAGIMQRGDLLSEQSALSSPLVLRERDLVKLAGIAHRDGWECHLYVTAVKLDDRGARTPPDASADSSSTNDPTAGKSTPE
jgi:hypothetical protein